MEVKYGKKSGMTLEQLAALYDAEMKKREEQCKRDKYELMELCGYFHTAQEMIDFVLNGGKIEDDCDGEWKQLIDGKIIYHKLLYNDIDMPIGFCNISQTIEEFKAWIYKCEEYQKEDGSPFVNEYWHPFVEDEF